MKHEARVGTEMALAMKHTPHANGFKSGMMSKRNKVVGATKTTTLVAHSKDRKSVV